MAIEEKVVLKGDTSDAQDAMEDFAKSAGASFVKAVASAAALKKAFDVTVGVMKTAVRNAIEYERTVLALQAASRNAGLAVDQATRFYNAQASELQRLTNISDETIRGMQAMALNMGIAEDKVGDFVKAAITLSNTTGQDATEALKQLVKTTSGLTGELGEAIPAIRELSKEELKAGEAAELINEALGENLGLLTEGTAGAEQGLIRAWDDFTEVLGRTVTEGGLVEDSLRGITNELNEMARTLQKGGLFALLAEEGLGLLGVSKQGVAALTGGTAGVSVSGIISSPENLGTGAKPTAPGRTRPRGRRDGGGGGKGGGISFGNLGEGFGLASFEDDGGFLGGLPPEVMKRIEAETEAEGAHQENLQKIRDDAATRYAESLERNAEKQIDAQKELHGSLEDAERESLDRRRDMLADFAENGIQLAGRMSQNVVDIAWEEHQKRRELDKDLAAAKKAGDEEEIERLQAMKKAQGSMFEAIAKQFLETTGKQLVSQGISDIATGTSTLIRGIITDDPKAVASGGSLAAWGAAEVVSGAAMMAGSLKIPGGGGVGGGGGGGGSGGAGGSIGDDRPSRGDGGGNTTIVVQGSLSNEETMLAVERGMRRSRQKGVT